MLTKEQVNIIQDIHKSKEPIVILTGAAGCGKSYTLTHWINNKFNGSVALTCTTHKAVQNLRDMGIECPLFIGTIHKWLKLVPTFESQNMIFKRRELDPVYDVMEVDLLVVDEYSMIQAEVYQGIKQDLESGRVGRVVLVGDQNQLLHEQYIKQYPYPVFSLYKQMRQKEGSELHKYLDSIRNSIALQTYEAPENHPSELIRFDNHRDFISEYKSCMSEDKIILAFQNITVTHYNRNIQKLMLCKDSFYNQDDKIIMSSSNKNFNNNEEVKIISVFEEEDYYRIFGVSKSNAGEIKVPKKKSWYKEKLDRFKEIGNWKSYHDFKTEYTFVHHAWALTVHKSQGSSYDYVFVDLTDLYKVTNNDELFRLVYVAYSRARKNIIVFDGENRDYKAFGK